MFITGYLLLDRDYDNDVIKKFWKKNLLPLLVTTEIWIVIYDVFLKFFFSQPFKWSFLVKHMLFLDRVKMGHMWYISMIIGVYIFIPFVARALKNVRFNVLVLPLTIVTVYLTIVPLVNYTLLALKKTGIWPVLSLDFSGGYYGLIFVIGYLYKRFGRLEAINGYFAALIGVLSYISVVALQLFYFSKGLRYPVWYNWFPLILASACLAIVAVKISRRVLSEENEAVLMLGRTAFGVYLVHFPLLMILNKYFPWQGILPMKVIFLFVVGLVLSYTIVLALSRVKKIRTILFYIK